MDFKVIKNDDGFFNLTIDRNPSITMVSLDRQDIIDLKNVLEEILNNEDAIVGTGSYKPEHCTGYGYNPRTRRMEPLIEKEEL